MYAYRDAAALCCCRVLQAWCGALRIHAAGIGCLPVIDSRTVNGLPTGAVR